MRSPSKIVAVTPAAIEIEKRAIEREKKGQFRIAAHLWLQCMDVASGLRKCLETANMLAHSGIRFVPIPAVTDAEFATLSAIFENKIESLAAEAEMEENQQNN